MEEDTAALFQELAQLFQELHNEITVVQHVLIDNDLVTEAELANRLKDVTLEGQVALRAEAIRRSYESALKRLPKQ